MQKIYKFVIGYLHDDYKTELLHIMLPKKVPSADVKSYDGQTNWMYFWIKDDLLEKYNTIWDKVSAKIKKRIW